MDGQANEKAPTIGRGGLEVVREWIHGVTRTYTTFNL